MRLLISLSLLLSLAACGSSGVAGKYSLDTKALVDVMKKQMGPMFDQMPADQKKQFDEMLSKMKVEMTLAADGTFDVASEMPDGKSQIKGTYKVEGDKITMTGKEVGKDKEEVKVGTVAGATITIEEEKNGQKMAMVFKKS